MTASNLQNTPTLRFDTRPSDEERAKMPFAYHHDYVIDLAAKHRFPVRQYHLHQSSITGQKSLRRSERRHVCKDKLPKPAKSAG